MGAGAHSVLRVRLSLRDLRGRRCVPVPVGHRVRRHRLGERRGDGRVHRDPGRGAALRVAAGGAGVDVTASTTRELGMPSIGPLQKLAPKPARYLLNWGRKYSLWVFNFGLAGCAIEFIATSMARHAFIRLGVIPFAPDHGRLTSWSSRAQSPTRWRRRSVG